jgi:hypothetical protein
VPKKPLGQAPNKKPLAYVDEDPEVEEDSDNPAMPLVLPPTTIQPPWDWTRLAASNIGPDSDFDLNWDEILPPKPKPSRKRKSSSTKAKAAEGQQPAKRGRPPAKEKPEVVLSSPIATRGQRKKAKEAAEAAEAGSGIQGPAPSPPTTVTALPSPSARAGTQSRKRPLRVTSDDEEEEPEVEREKTVPVKTPTPEGSPVKKARPNLARVSTVKPTLGAPSSLNPPEASGWASKPSATLEASDAASAQPQPQSLGIRGPKFAARCFEVVKALKVEQQLGKRGGHAHPAIKLLTNSVKRDKATFLPMLRQTAATIPQWVAPFFNKPYPRLSEEQLVIWEILKAGAEAPDA